ncbi:hypothetical protein [Streptomyces fumanus]|uniref:hypothetical protein n=1 Tax=Streptomyces fumanus TaxID=67302 RepID=UPI0033C2C574
MKSGAFVFFVFTVLILVTQIWAVMLVAGAMHSVAPTVPALSFNASGWLVFLAYLLVWPASVSGKK